MAGELELVYFPIWARVSSLLALEHSGLPWKYTRPDDWKELKPQCTWGCLPILRGLPAEHQSPPGSGSELGHEAAILGYVALRGGERMAGTTVSESLISKQLMGEGEDIYQALVRINAGYLSTEEALAFWDRGAQNAAAHNRKFGIFVILGLLEKFSQRCGLADQGKFTISGVSVGECKLWASLHALKQIDDGVFADLPGVGKFYERFGQEPGTQAIVSGDRTGGKIAQYFFKPSEAK